VSDCKACRRVAYVGRVGIPVGRVGWSELVGGASLLWGELTRNPSTDFDFEEFGHAVSQVTTRNTYL